MRHEQEERVDALVEFGFSIERARFLAIGRTLDQITYWTRRSAGKRDPEAYFLTLHAGNEPAPMPKASKDRPAPAEDTVERDRRNQEIGRLYDDLDAGMLDGAEDTLENRRAVLMRLGFSEFAAHELARREDISESASPTQGQQLFVHLAG